MLTIENDYNLLYNVAEKTVVATWMLFVAWHLCCFTLLLYCKCKDRFFFDLLVYVYAFQHFYDLAS